MQCHLCRLYWEILFNRFSICIIPHTFHLRIKVLHELLFKFWNAHFKMSFSILRSYLDRNINYEISIDYLATLGFSLFIWSDSFMLLYHQSFLAGSSRVIFVLSDVLPCFKLCILTILCNVIKLSICILLL